MSIVEKPTIDKFADSIRDILGDRVSQIILYGSYASDDFVPGSDVDIAVIVDEKRPGDEEKIWDLSEEFRSKHNVEFVPKIYENSFFRKREMENFSFYKEISEKGINV